jgi:hypothetical protein
LVTINSLLAAAALMLSMQSLADVIDGEEFRDPTRPLFADPGSADTDPAMSMIQAVTTTNFNVTFIRASDSNPLAVVNNQRVSVGDTVFGARVEQINRSNVVLSVNGQEQVVSLFESVARPSRSAAPAENK